jgi:methionyl-tRNA formyltransferase
MNILFLGERRISMNCVIHLINDPFFKVKAIVTNRKFYSGLCSFYSKKFSIDFISNDTRNTDAILSAIKKLDIDVLISVQHNWILPKNVLQAVNGNAFNLHNAKLPEYKGYNTIFHSLVNNDSTYTSTIHWMHEIVDSGDIIIEGITKIDADDTALRLYMKTVEVATHAFLSLLEMLKKKDIKRQSMRSGGIFFNRMSMEKIKNIDINEDPEKIERIIRASYFPPYEPAYINIKNKKNYLIPSEYFLSREDNVVYNQSKPYNMSEWE